MLTGNCIKMSWGVPANKGGGMMARKLLWFALGGIALGLVGCRHCETVVTVYYSHGPTQLGVTHVLR